MNTIIEKLNGIIEEHTSDIHIKENKEIWYRKINKMLKKEIIVHKQEILDFAKVYLEESKYNYFLNGNSVDFSLGLAGYRFRANMYYEKDGIGIALRKINNYIPTLGEIGIPQSLREYLLKDQGLILICGSTGSGKSTTLASMINFINQNKQCHIITLEDPIEYEFSNDKSLITQIEIGKDSPNWKEAIKNILRQDPDIIVVGEIRDMETMSTVLTLAETGHLVFSTLHTIGAINALNRVVEIYPTDQQKQVNLQLSMALQFVLSQKLLERKDGKGKVAARDILINTSLVSEHIQKNELKKIFPILETGSKYGMQTMERDLVKIIEKGIVSLETAKQFANNPRLLENMYYSGQTLNSAKPITIERQKLNDPKELNSNNY
ncbi:MAG: PilT/PilU family type 4a pilus ATPase [Candidatus Absconditabacteria bacterium]